MFFRVKPARGYRYLQIARSVRVEGKVRQEIIATLGRLDVLQESGQLDRLLRSGLRYCRQVKVLDAHAAGETEPVSIIKIGPELVFGRLWQDMGIGELISQLAGQRRYGFDLERALYLTVLHRLFASGSDRAAEAWKENYCIPGAQELALQHLYRAMAWLGEEIGEGVLGTPRCTKDLIEEALFDRGRDLFSEVGLVFFDTTSIYFEGAGGQSLGEYGHSKDHRPDLRQMVVGVALDVHGRPICCEMWPGNTADAKSLLPVVERMRAKFRVREMCVVSDRGMVSEATLEALGGMDPPVHYIVGVRMRRTREVGEVVLRSRARWQEVTPERQRAKDPAPLKVKEVEVEGRRYIVCLNEEEQRKDAHDRACILEALREQLRRGDKSLIGNKGYRRFLKIQGGGHFAIDEKQVAQEERYDGLFVLRTDTDHDAETIARVYKMLWMVEDSFRTAKSIMETRPIFHKCDETIRGHVFCSFLALVLKRELEIRMEQKGLAAEWAEVVRGLDNLQQVELFLQGSRFLLRSQLKGDASQAIRAAEVALPPVLEEIA
ncbi:MAG TPA: IS1634 family transposase [Terrimicrobium sp.]